MKTLLYIIITLIVISVSWVGLSKISPVEKTDTSVINDLTDNFLSRPKPESIIHLYDFTNNKWMEGEFNYIELTDLNINSIQHASIGTKSLFLRNEFKRKDEIKSFITKIDTIIPSSSNITSGKDNSAIYNPVAKELNRLGKSTTTNKIMLIYSDMMENTDKISFYDSDVLHGLKSKPEKMRQFFESQVKLNDLKGIRIYIIYQPMNTQQDNAFNIVSNFYKQFFESKGATVEITANLN